MTENNKKSLVKLVGSFFLIAIFLMVAYFIFEEFGLTHLTRQEIQQFIISTGVIAPIAFIAISFLQVTFIPVPGAITILAGNYLFGGFQSFVYSYIGMLIGALFAFFLGKTVGRPFVNWIVGSPQKVDDWLKKLKGKHTVILFFMFLLPFFPDDILCTVAGLLPIGYGGFMLMQVITRATSIGFTLLLMSGEFIPYHGWGIAVLGVIAAACIIAFFVSWKYSKEINDFFVRFTNKLFTKRNSQKEEDGN